MRSESVFDASVSYIVRSTASDDETDSSFEPAIGATFFGSKFVFIGLRSLWRVVFDFHLCIWRCFQSATYCGICICVTMTATHFGLGNTVVILGPSVRHHQKFEDLVLESDVSISKLLCFAVDIFVCRVRLDSYRFRDPYVVNYTFAMFLVVVGVEAFAQSPLTPIVQALLVCRRR
jgi:hypothetical protein